jgi:hypothetical protein
VVTIDTTDILNFVELELLSADEVLEVRSNLGQYQAYLQLKKYFYGGNATASGEHGHEIHVYRLVLLTEDDQLSNTLLRGVIAKTNANLSSKGESGSEQLNAQNMGDLEEGVVSLSGEVVGEMDMSSTSSAQGMLTSTNSFYRMIRDFKKVLGEKKTPKNLIYLNWILIAVFSLSIMLSSVEYNKKLMLFDEINIEYKHQFYSQIRTIKLTLIASNLRSLLNVANHYEPNSYEGQGLVKVDRLSYLSRLI